MISCVLKKKYNSNSPCYMNSMTSLLQTFKFLLILEKNRGHFHKNKIPFYSDEHGDHNKKIVYFIAHTLLAALKLLKFKAMTFAKHFYNIDLNFSSKHPFENDHDIHRLD